MFIKLKNYGNTCYFNSIMQIFFNMNDFINQLQIECASLNINTPNRQFIILFNNFLNNKTQTNFINTFNILGCKNEQSDANDLFSKILELLESTKSKYIYSLSYKNKENKCFNQYMWYSYSELFNCVNNTIINFPNYLFIYKNSVETIQKYIEINTNNIYYVYILLMFKGSDTSGHYYILIKKHDIWISIDDDSIVKIKNISDFMKMNNDKITTIIYKK